MQILIYLFCLTLLILIGIFFFIWHKLHNNYVKHLPNKKKITVNNSKFKTRFLTTSDGIKIAFWYLPVPKPKAVVILIHGYRESNADKTRMLAHAQYLNKAKYSTLLLDLRSFGESDGDKVTWGTKEWRDVETAYDYAKSLPENKNKKIGFLGKSMGGVTSIVASAISGKGDFIIALTPYASFKSLFNFELKKKGYYAPLFLPFLWLSAILEFGFNFEKYAPINLIKKIKVPIFIVGAKYDKKISKDDAKYLFDNTNNPKEFWQAPTDHDEIFTNNPAEFQKKILNFLSKYV